MATLTSQIESLIAYANETTGKADTKLGDAVKSLADGYGGGDDVTKTILEGTAPEVVIPEGVTALRSYVFRNWTALERISFPNSLRTIGSYCFLACPSLREVNLGEGVTSIGTGFTTSRNLLSLNIPASVKEIASDCLGTSYIVEIFMKGDVPPTLEDDTTSLPKTTDLRIYVPDSAIDTYKTKGNWRNYASRIFPMSSYPQ